MAKSIPYINLKPENVDEKAWSAVIEAWENGLSDREAAFRASKYSEVRITEDDIKGWKKDSREIADLKEFLTADLVAEAKIKVAKLIRSGDDKTVKWYLERKAANEFSSKAAIQFEGAVASLTLEDKDKALEEMLKGFKVGDGNEQ